MGPGLAITWFSKRSERISNSHNKEDDIPTSTLIMSRSVPITLQICVNNRYSAVCLPSRKVQFPVSLGRHNGEHLLYCKPVPVSDASASGSSQGEASQSAAVPAL